MNLHLPNVKFKQKTSAASSLSDERSLHFCFIKNHKICWRLRSTGEMRSHKYTKVDDNSHVLGREFETKTNTMLDTFTLFFCAMRWTIILFISYNCLLAVERLMPTLSTKRITIDWGRQQLDKTVVGWMGRWTPHCGHRLHFYRLKMTNSIINAAPNTQSTEAWGTSVDSQLPHRMSQQTVYFFFIFRMYDMHVHEFGRLPFSSFSLYLYLRLFSLSLCLYVCVCLLEWPFITSMPIHRTSIVVYGCLLCTSNTWWKYDKRIRLMQISQHFFSVVHNCV